ncbi:MAG: hypothetical protein IT430_16505 [Phycisphaerales bacterium]|nr:hypothetical protein [Phycisphaerales bacterium]
MPADPPPTASLTPLRGRIYCVGDGVGADDILAPEYLSFDLSDPAERRWLGAYALARFADSFGTFVPVGEFQSAYSILTAGRDFGRGSAREHSAIALHEAGVRCVVADSYAPGFLRSAVNGGWLHCLRFATGPGERRLETGMSVEIDLTALTLAAPDQRLKIAPTGVMLDVVAAGGLASCLKAMPGR